MERKHFGYFAIALAVIVALFILDRTYLRNIREVKPEASTIAPVSSEMEMEEDSTPVTKPILDEEEEE